MRLGYIKLARQLQEHPIWIGERFTRGQAWVDLLMLAQFTSFELRIRGNCVPLERGQIGHSKAYLAGRWKWDRKTVQKYLDYLEKRGMVTQQKTRVVTVITIVNYSTWQDDAGREVGETGQQNPQQTGQQNGQQNPQQTGHKEEGKERGKKVKKRKKKKDAVVFPESLDRKDVRAAWSAWEQHRKEKKSKLTPSTQAMQLKDLAEMGPEQAISSIEQSIRQGWSGLFEPKGNGKPAIPGGPKLTVPEDRATDRVMFKLNLHSEAVADWTPDKWRELLAQHPDCVPEPEGSEYIPPT